MLQCARYEKRIPQADDHVRPPGLYPLGPRLDSWGRGVGEAILLKSSLKIQETRRPLSPDSGFFFGPPWRIFGM